MAVHDADEAHRELHTLRADLWDLTGWADDQLNTDHDRQCIAEHLTAVLDALLRYQTPPRRPI
jgi:hypothetical protein